MLLPDVKADDKLWPGAELHHAVLSEVKLITVLS